jgi:DNA-binding beta-propeller fold protein YncE
MLCVPKGIAVHPDTGHYYIADTFNSHIQVLDTHGNFVRKWDIRHVRPNTQYLPWALCFDGARRLFVTDELSGNIDVFSDNGQYLRTLNVYQHFNERTLALRSIAIDQAGRVYVGCGSDWVIIVYEQKK